MAAQHQAMVEDAQDDGLCPWCGKRLFGELTGLGYDGERMHLWCAAEDADNATFDRDVGD